MHSGGNGGAECGENMKKTLKALQHNGLRGVEKAVENVDNYL